ncbi:hypothetical protein Tco_0002212 [Tanacetum coccineum]
MGPLHHGGPSDSVNPISGNPQMVWDTAVDVTVESSESDMSVVEPVEEVKPQEKAGPTEEVLVNPAHPDQLVTIDMTGVPKRILKHTLNANPSITLVSQKRRMFSSEKSQVKTHEVAEWLKSGIVRQVKYPIWISNPVLVQKGRWKLEKVHRLKNINYACLKDYYPLPELDCKIELVMGFPLKCFLDAYKGYHYVQMVEEDEEKTAFYTDQGTYYYTKIPFGLKNVKATYQRLVNEAFQS